MPILIVQIADDVPEALIDQLYRQISALPLIEGVMPIGSIDPAALREAIRLFKERLSPDERQRLGLTD